MPYTRPYAGGFLDYPNTTTPLTASALNTMDLGIKAANDQIQTLTTTQRNALAATLGQLVWDSDLEELFVYLNGSAGNAWFGLGNYIICTSTTRPATPVTGMRIYETDTRYNYTYIAGAWTPSGDTLICTFATRPATAPIGQLAYQTDTDEVLKYVTDVDGTNRWMVADHDVRRNAVINGSFEIWQRGVSFNPASATGTSKLNYGADRWQFLQATSQAGAFVRNLSIPTPNNDPPGFNYTLGVFRGSGSTYTTPFTIQQSFETFNIAGFRGKYATLSFWARKDTGYSAAGSVLVSDIVTGTANDDTVSSFTSPTVVATANNVLTTSWKRFSITTSAPLPALGNTIQLGVRFVSTPTGTAVSNDQFFITGVQLEQGTAPSDFEYRDVADELRRCQRYYYRLTSSGATANWLGNGFLYSAANALVSTQFPVTMRTTPTALEQSGTAANYAILNSTGTNVACTAVPTFNTANTSNANTVFTISGGLTAGQGTMAVANASASAYLGWSAEL